MRDATPADAGGPGGAGWTAALGLALALLAALAFLAARSSLWDRDEPRFARATVELLATGNWLYPTFNGELRPDKPIGIYWLMALPAALLGPVDAAFRLPAAAGAAAALLATFWLARRLLGGGAVAAAAVMATTPLTLATGAAATTDAVLLALLTLAHAALARALLAPGRRRAFLLLAAALAGALLVKGPVGLLPLLTALLTVLLARGGRPADFRFFVFALGAAAVAAGLFLAWALPADAATGGEFLRLGLGRHVVDRTLRPLESHGGPFLLYLPYHLVVPLFTFLPWTLHLPGALAVLAGGRAGIPLARPFLLAWLLAVLVPMSLVQTKLPHYVLPLWPALALAVGGLVGLDRRGGLTGRDRLWARAGVWLFAPGALAASAILAIGPWLGPFPGELRAAGGAGAVLLLALAVVAAGRHRRRGPAASVVPLVLWSAAGWLLAAGALLPGLDGLRVSRPAARLLLERAPAGAEIAVYRFREPSLLFHLGARPVAVLGSEAELRTWLARPEPGVLVVPASDLARCQEAGRPGPRILGEVEGLHAAKGRWIRLLLLGRGGPPG